jgi:hypothetical protein
MEFQCLYHVSSGIVILPDHQPPIIIIIDTIEDGGCPIPRQMETPTQWQCDWDGPESSIYR